MSCPLRLPTRQWNLVQRLLIIGTARLVPSLAYMTTRNLWVSIGAHLLGDRTRFDANPVGTLLLGTC